MRAGPLFLLLSACLALPAWAVPQATVAALQMPSWLMRGERTQPLAPGMEIRNGDILRTGEGARVYLGLAEGSTVKLGAATQMTFYARSINPTRIFRGALDIATGAFRFTSDQLRKVRGRDLTIRVGTATIGVRGTDVWGRSNEQGDLVCLIEGRVEVTRRGESAVLDQPLSFFVAPTGAAAKPVGSVDPEQLALWAKQTDLQPGGGTVLPRGRWSLSMGKFSTEAETLAQVDQLREAGYPARIKVLPGTSGGWDYEVRLIGFPSAAEAAAAAVWLKADTDVDATPSR